MTRTRRSVVVIVIVSVLVSLPLLLAVVVMASRIGHRARFVTWPVVAFTALAAIVVVVGVVSGLPRPSLLAAGLVPAAVLSYFLPAAPPWYVAIGLILLGGLAVTADGAASGLAAGTAALMIVLVVFQGPAVECGASSVSGNSGPWWIDTPSSSSGFGSLGPDGTARGTVQVGDDHYAYTCEDARLTRFERLDAHDVPTRLREPVPVTPGEPGP